MPNDEKQLIDLLGKIDKKLDASSEGKANLDKTLEKVLFQMERIEGEQKTLHIEQLKAVGLLNDPTSGLVVRVNKIEDTLKKMTEEVNPSDPNTKKHKIQREILVDNIQQSYDKMKDDVDDLVEWKESSKEAVKEIQTFKSWKENITKIFWIFSTAMIGLLVKTAYEFVVSVRR